MIYCHLDFQTYLHCVMCFAAGVSKILLDLDLSKNLSWLCRSFYIDKKAAGKVEVYVVSENPEPLLCN